MAAGSVADWSSAASYQPFGWRGRSDRLLIEIIDTSTLVGLHGAT
jgi:hypothetical protein